MSKFPNPIKTLLETNLTQRLNELGVKEPNLETYVLLVDKTDDYKYQTFDEIYRMWITPKIVGARIKLEKVLDFLENPMNCAPLRIKISLQRKLIILEFSQRFRSQKIIKESKSIKIIHLELYELEKYLTKFSHRFVQNLHFLLF